MPVTRAACASDAFALSGLMCRTIRHTNAADYPAAVIARILLRHTPDAVSAMIAARRVLVMSERDDIVGTVALEGAVLRGLFVDVGHQRRGLARGLVAEIERIAGVDGIVELELQSSSTAHGFYERLGYRTQAFRFDPAGSTYRMVKTFGLR